MKIKTLQQFQDLLDAELAWRKKEIADLKLVLKPSNSYSGISSKTLIRAGVPLVYAHWEGFIKATSEMYIEFVNSRKKTFQELSLPFVAFGAKAHMGNFQTSLKAKQNIELARFFSTHLDTRASNMTSKGAINTKSNLSAEVFENIALSIGIDYSSYSSKANLINQSLVLRRNQIAHGEYLDLDEDEFRDLADDVLSLIENYKTDLENAASLQRYLR